MNALYLLLIALCCAVAMGLGAKSGVGPNLRAAVRTRLIVTVGWSLAWISRRGQLSQPFSPRAWVLLAVSAFAVLLSWALYLWFRRRPPTAGPTLTDRINIVLVALLAITVLYGRTDATARLFGFLMVAGAFILSRSQR